MIKVRNEIGESPCFLCDFACSTKQKLAQHTSSCHNTEESLICAWCQFKFKDISSVRRHVKTVHINLKEYMCSYCNKKYKHKYDLEKHFAKVHKNEPLEGQNFCSECRLMCLGWEQLKQHYLDAHGKTIQHIKCPQCMKIFFDVSYLKQHFKRVHNNKTLSVVYCQHCGAVFEEDAALVRHMQDKHYWSGAVFCRQDRCDELFQDVAELEAHVQECHKGKRARVSGSYPALEVQCTECTTLLGSKLELVAHLTEQHHWRSVMECQKCNKLFPTCTEVQEHLNSHILEPEGSPVSQGGKQSILKKRLLKRKNIKDLSREIEPRFFVGFVRLDDEKEQTLQQEIEVETNSSSTTYHQSYHHGDKEYHHGDKEAGTSCHGDDGGSPQPTDVRSNNYDKLQRAEDHAFRPEDYEPRSRDQHVASERVSRDMYRAAEAYHYEDPV